MNSCNRKDEVIIPAECICVCSLRGITDTYVSKEVNQNNNSLINSLVLIRLRSNTKPF